MSSKLLDFPGGWDNPKSPQYGRVPVCLPACPVRDWYRDALRAAARALVEVHGPGGHWSNPLLEKAIHEVSAEL